MVGEPVATDVFAASYDLLGRFYLGGPLAARRSGLRSIDALLVAVGCVDPVWPQTLESLLPETDLECEAAQRAFLEYVVVPIPGRYVPPYASVYLDGGTLWGPSTFEVLYNYRAEGLSVDNGRIGPGGTVLVAPDHVGVEMAFLTVLSSRRSDNDRMERVNFFLHHLTAWLPQLAEAYRSSEQDTFARWTTWGAEVILADLKRRSIGYFGAENEIVSSRLSVPDATPLGVRDGI